MKRIISILLAAGILAIGGAAAVALAGNPHGSPPGQDPCSHGATGKECKPDPQPDRGKDCEKHGKYGGVNEDHCKPPPTTPTKTTPTETTPTETTPTITTPTETTPTVPQPPRCPPGMGPFAGKDGEPGNDECCPDVNNDQQCDVPAPPSTSAQTTQPPLTPAAPTATTPSPVAPAPVAPAARPKTAKPRASSTQKEFKKKPRPKLTGNPKIDKCKPVAGGVLNCKGVIVVPGQG